MANSTNPLTRNTFRVWDGLCRVYNWEYNAPLVSLIDTNYFKPGKGDYLYFVRWAKKEVI